MPKNQKKSIQLNHRVMCDVSKCRSKAMVSLCYDHYNKLLNNTITKEEMLMLKRLRESKETEKKRQHESNNRIVQNAFED